MFRLVTWPIRKTIKLGAYSLGLSAGLAFIAATQTPSIQIIDLHEKTGLSKLHADDPTAVREAQQLQVSLQDVVSVRSVTGDSASPVALTQLSLQLTRGVFIHDAAIADSRVKVVYSVVDKVTALVSSVLGHNENEAVSFKRSITSPVSQAFAKLYPSYATKVDPAQLNIQPGVQYGRLRVESVSTDGVTLVESMPIVDAIMAGVNLAITTVAQAVGAHSVTALPVPLEKRIWIAALANPADPRKINLRVGQIYHAPGYKIGSIFIPNVYAWSWSVNRWRLNSATKYVKQQAKQQ